MLMKLDLKGLPIKSDFFKKYHIYFLIEMYYSSEAIKKVNEKLAYFLMFFENILFPIGLRGKVSLMLGDL